jgi:hypothetical protein
MKIYKALFLACGLMLGAPLPSFAGCSDDGSGIRDGSTVSQSAMARIEKLLVRVANNGPTLIGWPALAVDTNINQVRRVPVPDLMVTSFTAGQPSVVDNRFQIPISVVVKNQGKAPAGVFKVKVNYIAGPGYLVGGFAYASSYLTAGAQVIFNGNVVFHPSVGGGVNVTLQAEADSCANEDSIRAYCRVLESNEGNNGSALVNVFLPGPH